jgi:hypothetical protein
MKKKYALLIRTVTYSENECSGSLYRSGEYYDLKHFEEYKELLDFMDQESHDDYTYQTYYTDLQKENVIQ